MLGAWLPGVCQIWLEGLFFQRGWAGFAECDGIILDFLEKAKSAMGSFWTFRRKPRSPSWGPSPAPPAALRARVPCRLVVFTSACGVSSGPCGKGLGTWYFLEKREEWGGGWASQGLRLSKTPPYLLTPRKFRREASLLSYGFQWFPECCRSPFPQGLPLHPASGRWGGLLWGVQAEGCGFFLRFLWWQLLTWEAPQSSPHLRD